MQVISHPVTDLYVKATIKSIDNTHDVFDVYVNLEARRCHPR